MSEEAAFLAALKANPADDTTRLVYADWLDENDEPAKAEYLRLVVSLYRGNCDVVSTIERFMEIATDSSPDWREEVGSRFELLLTSVADARLSEFMATFFDRVGLTRLPSGATDSDLPIRVLAGITVETAQAIIINQSAGWSRGTPTFVIRASSGVAVTNYLRWQVCAYYSPIRGGRLLSSYPFVSPPDHFAQFVRTALHDDLRADKELARTGSVILADNLRPYDAQCMMIEYEQLLTDVFQHEEWVIYIDKQPMR